MQQRKKVIAVKPKAVKVPKVDPIFFAAKDIMAILQCSKTSAYKTIRELNGELEAQGYMIRRGLINKSYFYKRFGITAQ